MNLVQSKNRFLRTIRTFISVYPSIYLPISRVKKGGWLVSKDTKIVIEGFPRSGNSYAEAAFRFSQKSDLKIAHHCHSAAQLMAAKRWRIPALVIIRNPLDACSSLIMHEPELFTAKNALKEYITFHEAIMRVHDWCVVASFEMVIEDFGEVVRKVNIKYGSDFEEFEKTDSEEAFSLLDSLSSERGTASFKGEPYSIKRSTAEKRERQLAKQELRAEITKNHNKRLLDRAESIYQDLYRIKDI
ncbi:hypothetical protein FT643_17500 [Ketobacter sp. MCCC 1A13808]|uniref:hypothetical protein n=1 Tax=Ketobacter sp. MCCC 1A13808 TaxID=2602738 RepID=UPI0012EC0BCD|nr:hypothetical protein [Ketobacter sp. MCCC 1A13808]MVF13938.1 hypothetical protein [Ketobacter sp. MCCC 1A13808]